MKGAAYTVGHLLKEHGAQLKLELVAGQKSLVRTVSVSELNRPGLALAGFFERFRAERIQIMGIGEQAYCLRAEPRALLQSLESLLSFPELPCVIMTHAQKTPSVLIQACRKKGIPLLRSSLETATLVSELSEVLESRLAPSTTLHGVLVDVYGLGVLIQGDPGMGKSECALELLKRGHILIADDVVLVQHRRGGTLRGTCPETVRNFMEVRGLGVIDIKLLFGIGSILDRTRIELAVRLEPWSRSIPDRVGLEIEKTRILDVEIPLIRIPVSPGRNLAVLIEVAALNQRLRSHGYFSAESFNRKLMEKMRVDGQ